MVDRETLSRRLVALREYSDALDRFRGVGLDEFLAEPAVHHLAERYLHLAVECVLDVANHVIAAERMRTPETNADTFRVLEEAGEIDSDLAARLRSWAGFRNVLVHLYLDIDHSVTWKVLQEELGDLEEFATWAEGKLP